MGEVSGNLADLTIITSDNPRFEKPEDIMADIVGYELIAVDVRPSVFEEED